MQQVCASCGERLEPADGAREAEVGTVRGTRDDPAVWRCPAGHERHEADPEAVRAGVEAGFDVARRTRLRGELRCGVCDHPYVLPGRRATRSVTVDGLDVPPVRLTFDVPLLRCTEDAVEGLPPECLEDLRAVVATLIVQPSTSA